MELNMKILLAPPLSNTAYRAYNNTLEMTLKITDAPEWSRSNKNLKCYMPYKAGIIKS